MPSKNTPNEKNRGNGRDRFFFQSPISVWIGAATISATLFRGGFLSLLAVEHYDEGVYTSNLIFDSAEGGEFPGRAFFAPPLWPAILELTQVLGLMFARNLPEWWPMLPGIVCGIALIPSAGWISHRWFGPTAAIASAWLIALSEFHAFYSRTALTDAPLLLAWLWAVAAMGLALESPNIRAGVVAGLVTAVAWWTKYNGWLPLAIGLSGGTAVQLMRPPPEGSWTRFARTMVVVIATAAMLWLPVLWDCQSVGGYAAVAANHRGYAEPWSNWWPNLQQHGRNLDAYLGGATVTIWCLAAGSVIVAAARSSSSVPRLLVLGWAVAFIGIANILGWSFSFLLTASFSAIGLGLSRWRRGELSSREILVACLLSAWLLGLLLATPLYRPYPRLVLPLWLAMTLGSAWLMSQVTTRCLGADPVANLGRRAHQFGSAVVTGVAIAMMFFAPNTAWEDRTTMAKAADDLSAAMAVDESPVIFVYGEPALFRALRERGQAAILAGHLNFAERSATVPTYFVVGLYADRDAGFQPEWQRVQHQFEPVRSWSVRPSSLVRFDNDPPGRDQPSATERPLTLYRLRR